jgi:hypothetical protein
VKVTAVDGGPRLYFVHLLGEQTSVFYNIEHWCAKSNTMSKKDNLVDFMNLYKRAGYTQKAFAEALTQRFEQIGSNRKVTTKSIREWNARKFEPRLTPSETLEMCLLLNCNLYDLALATKSTPPESREPQTRTSKLGEGDSSGGSANGSASLTSKMSPSDGSNRSRRVRVRVARISRSENP